MEGIGLKRGVLRNNYKLSDQVLMVFLISFFVLQPIYAFLAAVKWLISDFLM